MADLSSLELFVKVVDLGSFTAAADAFEVSKSHVSRQVSALEERLGARLLNRTTRQVTLTEVGRMFHERCTQILEQIAEAESVVTNLQKNPTGQLRVSAPMSFGVRYLAPLVSTFMRANPDLSVDVQFSDRRIDLVEEGFDVAVRIGKLPDSSLIARRLADTNLLLCASPGFLSDHGVPAELHDLRSTPCLLYSYQGGAARTWQLQRGEESQSVHVEGPLHANNGDALLQAARVGLGVCFAPDFLAADDLRSGALVRVLPAWGSAIGVWAVYPHRRYLPAKVRSFVDYVAGALVDPPWANCDAVDSTRRKRGKKRK